MESGTNEKMKVLWFTNTPSLAEDFLNEKPMGGGWIKSLEQILQKKVDLSVAFYHNKQLNDFTFGQSSYYPVFQKKQPKWRRVKNKLFNVLEPGQDVDQFIQIIEKVKPDVIHIHGTEYSFGLVQKHVTIPVVISIQGNLSVYSHKFFSGISYLDVLRGSSLVKTLRLKSFIQQGRWFSNAAIREQEIFKLSSNIIGRTHWDRRIAKVLSPSAKYFHNDEILRNSFYTDYNQRNQTDTLDTLDTLNIFTTTSPGLYKGLETVLFAAKLLDKNHINFTWTIAGLDKGHELIRLSAKALKAPVSPNLQFAGRLNEQEVKQNLLRSDIYVMPSHIENSPNNLCEAQILGVPCIATYAGGTSSLMIDREEGVLIQDGDPYVMAGAIMELAHDPQLRISIATKARTKALDRHKPGKIAAQLLDIYQHIKGQCQLVSPSVNQCQLVSTMSTSVSQCQQYNFKHADRTIPVEPGLL